jgi:hypothetical protein
MSWQQPKCKMFAVRPAPDGKALPQASEPTSGALQATTGMDATTTRFTARTRLNMRLGDLHLHHWQLWCKSSCAPQAEVLGGSILCVVTGLGSQGPVGHVPDCQCISVNEEKGTEGSGSLTEWMTLDQHHAVTAREQVLNFLPCQVEWRWHAELEHRCRRRGPAVQREHDGGADGNCPWPVFVSVVVWAQSGRRPTDHRGRLPVESAAVSWGPWLRLTRRARPRGPPIMTAAAVRVTLRRGNTNQWSGHIPVLCGCRCRLPPATSFTCTFAHVHRAQGGVGWLCIFVHRDKCGRGASQTLCRELAHCQVR